MLREPNSSATNWFENHALEAAYLFACIPFDSYYTTSY
jgi:hypothetical protein